MMGQPQVSQGPSRSANSPMSPGYRLLWMLVRAILKAGWHLRVQGLKQLPARSPYIIASNHPSEIDPVVLSAALPFRPTFLAARELERFPALFAIIQRFDPIFVRRGLHDVGAIEACLERLRRGDVLVIFPEGRVVQQQDPGPLHRGAAFLAIRARVPIVPVGLLGLSEMWPLGARWPRPSRISVRIGSALPPPDDDGNRDAVMTEAVGQAIRTLLSGNSD